ncbi:glycosyltransferase family 2 protein [Robbsia andropogonis]|uniref:glycosyltransferase family 2 protein n=1 Tax=Robbsia andropogonis TaxID=28092 RepID=UPI002A6A2CD7|nr:glycosyltransferase family 2 protein [Robbsia andropogonis]
MLKSEVCALTDLSSPVRRVGVVVVFYHPDDACIRRANRLSQRYLCVVVDNTPKCDRRDPARSTSNAALDPGVVYLSNGANLGIATAFNRGISCLREQGCDIALLFDQDSEPDDMLLTQLPLTLAALRARGERVAVVGPAYRDSRFGGVTPFVRFDRFSMQRVEVAGDTLLDIDFLISSGSCINVEAWTDLGVFDDDLFIDFVDFEWCVRAKHAGYRVIGVPWLQMTHQLGEEPVLVFGRRYPMHSATRHYYLFRNSIAMLKRRYVPLGWKLPELYKIPSRFVVYALFPQDRSAHIGMALRGLWHGLIGRSGPL